MIIWPESHVNRWPRLRLRDTNGSKTVMGFFSQGQNLWFVWQGFFDWLIYAIFFTGMTKIVTNIILGKKKSRGYFCVMGIKSTFSKVSQAPKSVSRKKSTAHSTTLHDTTPQQSDDTTPDQRNNKITSTLHPRPQLTIYPSTTLHDATKPHSTTAPHVTIPHTKVHCTHDSIIYQQHHTTHDTTTIHDTTPQNTTAPQSHTLPQGTSSHYIYPTNYSKPHPKTTLPL